MPNFSLHGALERFHTIYPGGEQPRAWLAPGRVNLIGEHTDYNLGLVLPMAIDLACLAVAAPAPGGKLRVYSEQFRESAEWRIEEIPDLRAKGHWSDRVIGVAWVLARNGVALTDQNLLIDSDVPLGGGLSSSAALGVALTLALGGPRPPLEIALLARKAETDFTGVPCGIMDQFVSAHGQAGAAILLDCRSLDWRAVELPKKLAIVVTNSMVKHDLASSGYRDRVAECHAAARALGVQSLRDVRPDQIDILDPLLRKRARHVITENARVEAFAAAAGRGDTAEMGRLATESHRSLRDDYEVSCAELDFLVEAALRVPGVLGARMTGGGFGGSTVTFIDPDAVQQFRPIITAGYQRFNGRVPEIHICTASQGAREIPI
ncbi:MAG TPA: galactokinase [Bryobacteraceae bacterium]|nr:galactokinase [Bryobacteraceae bacterium]